MGKISLKMTKSQIKKRATAEFFSKTQATPRPDGLDFSVALIMAGVPAAGKTEFINSFVNSSPIFKDNALRIYLDEIIKIFEEYTPEEDYKFRDNGSAIIERILDKALKDGYNFILDGTFSGEASVKNIERALNRGYIIMIVVLLEEIERAKQYAQIRQEKTKREIKDEAYKSAVDGIKKNLNIVKQEFITKGLPIKISFIEKKWNSDNSSCEYIQGVDIDNYYKN